jgi:hypothetical protein
MQKQDYEYFLQNTDQFYKQYGHKHLAIKDQGIHGVYGTFNEALENTLKAEPLVSFLIGRLGSISRCFAAVDSTTLQLYLISSNWGMDPKNPLTRGRV